MICVSVLYPHRAGARFDFAYYAENHMALVRRAGSYTDIQPQLQISEVVRS